MLHALVVDECELSRTAMHDWLAGMGYASVDLTDSEAAALSAASKHVPDLIMVGDPLSDTCPAELAEHLAAGRTVPVILVSRRGASAVADLPEWVHAEGPYHLDDLGAVLDTFAACQT